MNITQSAAATAATAANGGINPQNLYSYQHHMPNGALHCFLEVDEGENEGPDKPGFETSLKLVHAMANGMDVAPYLNEETVTQIEKAALKHRATPEDDPASISDPYENRLFGGRCAGAWGWLS